MVPFQVVQMNIVCHFEEEQRRIARIRVRKVMNLAGHPVYRFIGEFFRNVAAATCEHLDELRSNSLILLAGLVPVAAEPIEQSVEVVLC